MKYLLIAGLSFLGACTSPPIGENVAKEFTQIIFADMKATKTERTACEMAGGTVKRAGRLGAETCIQPYSDAGDACLSATDCLGRCELKEDISYPEPGIAADGVCQATTNSFGCSTLIEDGKIKGTLCID